MPLGKEEGAVSIPRSGFCSFKLNESRTRSPRPGCFNPSVGILFIQALLAWLALPPHGPFQSLGRDSVHSSICQGGACRGDIWFQSLGRDSVHSSMNAATAMLGSPPFQSLGRDSVHSSYVPKTKKVGRNVFQSLGRDSVHSS